MMAVKVQFEIGHTSKLRAKKSPEGFTHDWELYVQGVNKADISTFVEKVIFNLHDTFPKPKRVLKEVPYAIQESGYAGFTLPIDIYFRNSDEPKRVRFDYDLDLQNSGPPQHRSEIKNFIFECPAEELRAKLLKGGGVPVAGVISGGISESANVMSTSNVANDDGGGMVSKPKLSGVGGDKKHKSRVDDAKMSTFATLFGPPITKTSKPSPDNRATSSIATNANNTLPVGKEKSSKDKSSSTVSSEKTKNKSEKKDKQKQNSPHKDKEKKSSYGEKQRSGESKKDKTRDKEHEGKREKSSSSSHRDSSSHKRAPSQTSEMSSSSPKKLNPPSPKAASTAEVKNESKLIGGTAKSSDGTAEAKPKESSKSKEQSSSSGRKSKKDKKDKDKERERERDKDKDKDKPRNSEAKAKEPITNNESKPAAAALPVTDVKKNLLPATAQNSNSSSNSSSNNGNSSKRSDKDVKQPSIPKVPEKPIPVKETSNDAPATAENQLRAEKLEKKSSTTTTKDQVSTEKDKKSHKHKKKDKSKDRDKERERERDKEKNKERERDKDKDKEKEKEKEKGQEEKKTIAADSLTQPTATTPATAATNVSIKNDVAKTEVPALNSNTPTPTPTLPANPVNNNTAAISPTKKSQSKEKKSKDKGNRDELKRQRDGNEIPTIAKKKHKTSSSKSSVQEPELSDMDSVQSTSDILPTSNNAISATASAATANNAGATVIEPSDSSSSSFPDLPPKSRNNASQKTSDSATSSPIPTGGAVPTKEADKAKVTSTETTNNNSNAGKETKQRTEKPSKANEKPEKVDKSEKDSKKRKRSLVQQQQQQQQTAQSASTTTFIEPPVKQAKKEQTKAAREKSKSPALRATAAAATASSNASASNSGGSAVPQTASDDTAFLPPPVTGNSAASVANNTHNNLASPVINNNNVSNNNNNTIANEQMVTTPASGGTAAAALTNTNTTSNVSPVAGSTPTTATPSTILATGSTTPTPPASGTTWPAEYLNELQELHHKIMTLQDNDELQQVVEMIAATGCYEITTKTFDFDLCKLDRSTVQRLQEFLSTCVS